MPERTASPGAMRAWFRGVEPMCAELFGAAWAMCGNRDLAEQALCSALVELYLQDAAPGFGFRERARSALRDEVFALMDTAQAQRAEFDWPGLPAGGDDPILELAADERLDAQQLLLLKYGCGLSVRSIAGLLSDSPERLRAALDRFEARCRRALSSDARGRAENVVAERFQRLLSRGMRGAPPSERLYRTFESEASRARTAGHRAQRIVGRVVLIVMALLCAAMFWLFAVLVQPTTPSPAGAEFVIEVLEE